jgi:short-subunit dehydrogenase
MEYVHDGLQLVCDWWQIVAAWIFVGSTLTIFAIYFVSRCFTRQNLAEKYDAKWAVITGGSSGIGLALARELASDGINLVLVGLPDQLMESAVEELSASVEVRAVRVNLAQEEYMPQIIEATEDITVGIIVCNAGYIASGLFDASSIERQVANFKCNALHGFVVAHHFVDRLKVQAGRGCVFFTSSPAGLIPSPMSAMYGATKAFLTSFGVAMAAELRPLGIDVGVIHPSPVATNF